ncbi:hypothetical protein F1188_15220 [Roseospira marina]|uniref:STAS/SEC14 domain-containing protein n=1 Tax=Roseospira marina TaxID=140057 RepID=A0A5M6I8P4_9PROT|nr:hypothetical protein [Roseospira marina]KAA5604563.1 hypothetical protein F1188_15220 [Roseospira marina]MBB4315310.1 hypothetical protein [Roseospira marina]MBB5088309.1 hypothetical protein [Roseospira marina]
MTEALIEHHAACTVVVRQHPLPDGRTALAFAIHGEFSSGDFAVCLERFLPRIVLPGHSLVVMDLREAIRSTDAHGLFQQAELLTRARVWRLSVSYVSTSETAEAVMPLVRDVFEQVNVAIDTHIAPTLEDALVWLATQT